VISGENWNDVMYLGYEAIGTQAVVFLVAVYVIGNMLLMNLFIAILIDTFVQQTVRRRPASTALCAVVRRSPSPVLRFQSGSPCGCWGVRG
jgi:hypothetical protein